jgi:transcriptional regulator with XRE-family HTH domain
MGNYATPYWVATNPQDVGIIPDMGNRLKFLREGRGWTQERAAAEFDLSKSGYIKIERGERELTADRIAKAAKIYGVTKAEVLDDPTLMTDGERDYLLGLYDRLPPAVQQVALRQIEDLVDAIAPRPEKKPKPGETQ